MGDLLSALIYANGIIENAYSQWEESNRLQWQANETYNRKKKNITVISFVSIIPLLYLSGFLTAVFLTFIHETFHNDLIDNSVVLLMFIGTNGIAVFCYLFFLLPIFRTKKKKNKAEYDKMMADAAALYQSSCDLINANVEYICFLPSEYCYPLATRYMVSCVQQQRAFTLQEAMDRFDEQLHKWTMESSQQQILEQQRWQTQQLDAIRNSVNYNTAVTAAGFAANFLLHL